MSAPYSTPAVGIRQRRAGRRAVCGPDPLDCPRSHGLGAARPQWILEEAEPATNPGKFAIRHSPPIPNSRYHIPATVCMQCSEKTFDAETTEGIRQMLHGRRQPAACSVAMDVYAY